MLLLVSIWSATMAYLHTHIWNAFIYMMRIYIYWYKFHYINLFGHIYKYIKSTHIRRDSYFVKTVRVWKNNQMVFVWLFFFLGMTRAKHFVYMPTDLDAKCVCVCNHKKRIFCIQYIYILLRPSSPIALYVVYICGFVLVHFYKILKHKYFIDEMRAGASVDVVRFFLRWDICFAQMWIYARVYMYWYMCNINMCILVWCVWRFAWFILVCETFNGSIFLVRKRERVRVRNAAPLLDSVAVTHAGLKEFIYAL